VPVWRGVAAYALPLGCGLPCRNACLCFAALAADCAYSRSVAQQAFLLLPGGACRLLLLLCSSCGCGCLGLFLCLQRQLSKITLLLEQASCRRLVLLLAWRGGGAARVVAA
jgi:hypothetical protein